MDICNCNFNSQYAYIVKDNYDKLNNKISIEDYLKDDKLKDLVKKKKKFLACENMEELILCESEKIKSYFKHKNCESGSGLMTKWHKEWESHFENSEIYFGNRRADAVVDNKVLEFQHSNISKEEIDNRSNDYNSYNKVIYWIIDCTRNIKVDNKDDRYMITFLEEPWKYQNFINQQFIYLDNDNKIYRIMPDRVKSNMIDVKEFKTKEQFINDIKNNNDNWDEDELVQCVLYHNQRGAGCGKTYESIQLIEKDPRFKIKTTFIYLTKMHSAKEVIYNEFKEQYDRGSLSSIELADDGENLEGKQYKINFINKNTNKDCNIIIGTIDSFMFAVADTNKINKDRDYFASIVKSIRGGNVNTTNSGSIKYAKKSTKLNKECLIIIDEAQDLDPVYIEAITSIMRRTYIDTYVIGDKLQSIWWEHNIHTFLEENDLPTITIDRNIGTNHVMRFHNTQFIKFVNDLIDFNKYNLPSIQKICENNNCKYKHENEIEPFNLFTMNAIYADDADEKKINAEIEKIINYIEEEINKYNYLPNNFMFIFPTLKRNALANRLESRLQNFWINKFNNKNYQKILKKNDYWKDKLNDNYYKYVVLHKSEDGQPINLKESENSTRLLSIHASKGSGCEVVFLLGLTESSLRLFSKEKCNLVYDSLLHVAVTRQKKSLYVGLIENYDDIYNRFNNLNINITIDKNIIPSLNMITTATKYEKIPRYIIEHKFNEFNEKYLNNHNYENNIPNNKDKKDIIDWGHHIIRYSVLFYDIMCNIVNNQIIDKDNEEYYDQFTTILNKLSKNMVTTFLYEKYYEHLNKITKNNKYNIIPILCFDTNEKTKYSKYKDILIEIIINIQNKIKKCLKQNKIPILCPLETVIIQHLMDVTENGRFVDITVMDIYSIMYCYDECSNELDEKHDIYKCLCRKYFNEGNDNTESNKYKEIRMSIQNHYEKTLEVKKIYTNLINYIKENIEDPNNFKYNINHGVSLYSKNKNFNMWNTFDIIGYSDKSVIHFLLIPQFNKLNFNEKIINVMLNHFLIYNCNNDEKNNISRFKNKKIYSCILTLDSTEPIFYEFNITNEFNNYIKSYLIHERYGIYHPHIYNFYNYCKETKPSNMNSINYTLKKIEEYNKLPSYIHDFFYDISKEIENNKNNIKTILNKVNDKTLFLKEMDDYLYKSCDKYINSYEEFDEENDY